MARSSAASPSAQKAEQESRIATAAAAYPEGTPGIYALPNFALNAIEGTEMNYAQYVAAHSAEWTNIMTNLGFYWADNAAAPAEPDWDNLDWATLTQKAE